MKTVSDIKASDVLASYRPEHHTLAIVDTLICHVEQVLMLAAADEDSVPENAFVVVTPDGTRFVECDSRSQHWNGTAMPISTLMPFVTEEQYRFFVKNIITSLKAEGYTFDAVVEAASAQLHIHRIKGIGLPANTRFPVPVDGPRFIDYMRDLCHELREEIMRESEENNNE